MKPLHWFFLFLSFFVIAALIYSPSLGGPWQYDDYAQILDNKVLTGRPLPKLLSSIFRFTAHPDGWTGTRDFVRATFLVNWQWWGEKPLGYRWINLTIHVINATLVSALVALLLERTKDEGRRTAFSLAALSGLLFLVHPLNSQAVAYVAQRFTSVATMFYLGTIVCWLLFLRRRHYFLLLISYFLALLAYNSKEITVTLPVALLLVFLAGSKEEGKRQKAKGHRFLLPSSFFLLPFLLLALKIPLQTATAASRGGDTANPALKIVNLDTFALRQKDDLLSRRDYFLTQISVVATYLRLAVLPVNQTLDYDYPVTRNLDSKTLALAGLHLGLLLTGCGLWVVGRGSRMGHGDELKNTTPSSSQLYSQLTTHNSQLAHNSQLIGLGILWFYLTLLPESSIIPIPDVIYEHRAYLPMVGLILAAAGTANFIIQNSYFRIKRFANLKSYILILISFLFLLLSAATLRRASVWGNEVRLWADVFAKAPEKPRAVKNYGVVLAASGKYDRGIELLEKAVVLDPDNADYWSNLGTANLRANRFDQAKDKFLTAYSLLAAELNFPSYDSLNPLNPPNSLTSPSEKSRRQAAQYLNDYGVCLVQLGRGEAAQTAFEKSLAIDPGLYAARLGLGAAFNLQNNIQAATDVFESLVEEYPDQPDAYNNLAVMYKKAGRLEDRDRIIKAAPKSLK